MVEDKQILEGVGGWLLIYLIGSVPPLIVYSMGLSGWFLEYPLWLMVAIFVVLAIPLVLILLKSPSAPGWNIAMLWTVAALMTLRSISVFLFPMAPEGAPPPARAELVGAIAILATIVTFTVVWASVWTRYFKESVRVANTFS